MLLLQVREKVDFVNQLKELFPGRKEVLVLKDSISELEKLEKKGLKYAKLALENVLKQKVKVLDIQGGTDVDTNILNAALKQNAFIATNDRLLRKQAKDKGLSTLAFNKSKKKIVVV
ncbi:MAG: hypothetical protein JW791_03505 [Nanoarchaeota archaeon]|nr:hypothetical protein [Nanoarchaeota archaeon]